jgi:hypothetical protein
MGGKGATGRRQDYRGARARREMRVWEPHRRVVLTTSLYELLAAIHDVIAPGEDRLVVPIAIRLLRLYARGVIVQGEQRL